MSEIQDDLHEAIISLTNTKELRKVYDQKEDQGGKNDMCKAIDDLMKDCREEGREEGRRTGIREGECSGRRSTLVNCIIEILKKFGTIPSPLLKRIQMEANIDVLSQWFSFAVHADSIENFEIRLPQSHWL